MDNRFSLFEVGKPYEPAIGMGEGVRFTLSSEGGLLLYVFDNPTSEEIDQMRSGKGFEIRFATINGIIWVTSKCGDLEWTDAPYNPRLSGGLPAPDFEDGEGIALTLVMINAMDGVVKSVRLIGLGTSFSHYLVERSIELRDQPMTMVEANHSINQTMLRNSSRQLADIAPSQARYRL